MLSAAHGPGRTIRTSSALWDKGDRLREAIMHTFPALVIAVAGAVACTGAMAQDRNDMRAPPALGSRATV